MKLMLALCAMLLFSCDVTDPSVGEKTMGALIYHGPLRVVSWAVG